MRSRKECRMPNQHRNPSAEERDERVTLPIDPEAALRALLQVDLDDEPEQEESADDKD